MSKARSRREEVLRWLAVRQREGLTYEELARRSGIPRNTLTSWSSRLRKESEDKTGAGFVELRARESGDRSLELPSDPVMTAILDGGLRIEVEADIPARLLDPLFQFLADRC